MLSRIGVHLPGHSQPAHLFQGALQPKATAVIALGSQPENTWLLGPGVLCMGLYTATVCILLP